MIRVIQVLRKNINISLSRIRDTEILKIAYNFLCSNTRPIDSNMSNAKHTLALPLSINCQLQLR